MIFIDDWSLKIKTSSGSRRADTIDHDMARYTKMFPEVGRHFGHDDIEVTKMVGFASRKVCWKILSQSELMAIAEPFCKKYKPSVRADDGFCYWEDDPTLTSVPEQGCDAKEVDEEERVIYWDSLFNRVDKNASVVTEFNLVTRQQTFALYVSFFSGLRAFHASSCVDQLLGGRLLPWLNLHRHPR